MQLGEHPHHGTKQYQDDVLGVLPWWCYMCTVQVNAATVHCTERPN